MTGVSDGLVGGAAAQAMRAAVSMVEAGLRELGAAEVSGLRAGETLELLGQLEGVQRRLDAARLRLVAEADVQDAAIGAGTTSTAAWLRHALGMHPGAAGAQVRLARALAPGLNGDDGRSAGAEEARWAVPGLGPDPAGLPATGAALAAGRISAEAARVVAETMRRLPAAVSSTVREEAEDFLLARAGEHDPQALRLLAMRLEHVIDPDRGGALAAREEAQVASRELYLSDTADGCVRLHGRLDAVAGAALRSALDPLAAPRPAADGSRDLRSPARRRADALADLIAHALDGGGLPAQAGERPHLSVTVSLATLRAEPGAPSAALGWGGEVSATTARLIGCDARVVPVIVDRRGEPLHVGRASRTVTPAIRRALVARDRGCAFPGCQRPPAWCDGHHTQHWADGGPTSLSNTVLLCAFHHRRVHHGGWQVRLCAGFPEFIPPPGSTRPPGHATTPATTSTASPHSHTPPGHPDEAGTRAQGGSVSGSAVPRPASRPS